MPIDREGGRGGLSVASHAGAMREGGDLFRGEPRNHRIHSQHPTLPDSESEEHKDLLYLQILPFLAKGNVWLGGHSTYCQEPLGAPRNPHKRRIAVQHTLILRGRVKRHCIQSKRTTSCRREPLSCSEIRHCLSQKHAYIICVSVCLCVHTHTSYISGHDYLGLLKSQGPGQPSGDPADWKYCVPR